MARSTANTAPVAPETDAPAVDDVQAKIDALPGSTVSAVVSALLTEAVESHRWTERKSRADVLKEALTEWAEKRDLLDKARETLAAKVNG